MQEMCKSVKYCFIEVSSVMINVRTVNKYCVAAGLASHCLSGQTCVQLNLECLLSAVEVTVCVKCCCLSQGF